MHLRLKAYIIASFISTLAAIQYAYETRQQFYPAVVFLTSNKFCVMILGNMGICLTLLLGRLTKSIFFGNLREHEIETLYDNSRYAVTETCLALTIFREELNVRVFVLFVSLLFCKAFHWLAKARVDHLEQTAMATRVAHIRLVALMLGLLLIDSSAVGACVSLWKGPSVLILFGFEFAILAVDVLSIFVCYLLHIVDMRIEGTWHNKASYTFLLEFLTEVVRFCFYLIFFCIIFTYYGMPLHIVRDLWGCYSKLRKRLQDYNKYRQLTSNMNERFPDATPEQLETCEHTCIICRDHMDAGKMLPCTHIFHFQCLRLWLQHQQSCPTCRAEIPATMPAPSASHPPAPPQQQPPGAPPAVAGANPLPAAGGAAVGPAVAAPANPGTIPGVPTNAPAPSQQPAAPTQNSIAPSPHAQGGVVTSRLVQVQSAALQQPLGVPQQTIYGNPILPSMMGTGVASPVVASQFVIYRVISPTTLQLSSEPEEPVTGDSTVLPVGTMLCSFETRGTDWVKAVAIDGASGWVRVSGPGHVATVEALGSPGPMPIVPLVPLTIPSTPSEENVAPTPANSIPPATPEVPEEPVPEETKNDGYEEKKDSPDPPLSPREQSKPGLEGPPTISVMRASLERVQNQIARLKEEAPNEEKSSVDGLWERVQIVSAEGVTLISSSQNSNLINAEDLQAHIEKLHQLEEDITQILLQNSS